MKKLVLNNIYFLLFIFFLVSSCGGPRNTSISLVYLFDISGSFYRQSLTPSISLAKSIFDNINSPNGLPYYPQIHQVTKIDEMSVNIGGNCNIRIKQKNIFDDESTDPIKVFKDCIDDISNSKMSRSTDITGALLTASKSLQNDELYGKGIIIFSDLHEVVFEKKKYPINLKDISIFVIYEWSEYQINNPELQQQHLNDFNTMLQNAGCKSQNILIKNLSSVIASPEMVSNFFRKSFRND